ncbi:hypothetical protein [Mycoplasma sp. 4404]|uniref:hypothetical protein n=1 Tax=Mycoplasma sp. 4404 TaxID=3108530 RepID=UPI002B1DCC8D|nr:hypothetical protein [Mycoplasma sp. 4404]MEA4162660.1 hypothetical protein [Mycoplasma sp. 4404]
MAKVLFILIIIVSIIVLLLLVYLLSVNLFKQSLQKFSIRSKDAITKQNHQNQSLYSKVKTTTYFNHELENMLNSLIEVKQSIETINQEISVKLSELDELLAEKQKVKSYKKYKAIKQQQKEVSKKQIEFNKISDDYSKNWNNIDEITSTILEIRDFLNGKLKSYEKAIPNQYENLQKKLAELSIQITLIDDLKVKADFLKALENITKRKEELENYTKIIFASKNIEYSLFESLPKVLEQAIKDKNNEQIKGKLIELKDKTTALQSAIKGKNTAETLDVNIKSIYRTFYKLVNLVNSMFAIKDFIDQTIPIIRDLYSKLNKTHKNILAPNSIQQKNYEAVKNAFDKIKQSFENKSLKNIQTLVQDLVVKYENYEKTNVVIESKSKELKELNDNFQIQIDEAIDTYLSCIYHPEIPNDPKINKLRSELIYLYERNFKKQKSWNKIKTIWDEFISKLATLIKVISLNAKYKEIYNNIRLELQRNDSFINNQETFANYIDISKSIENVIKEENNYKNAYLALKKFLIKEKYVQ